MKYCFSFFFLLITHSLIAQSFEWLKTPGNNEGVTITSIGVHKSTGKVYAAGNFKASIQFDDQTLNSVGDTDIFINKYTPSGELLWTKRIGGTGKEEVKDVAVDDDGSLYVTGYYSGEANFDGVKLSTLFADFGNAFLAKFSSDGALVFIRSLGEDREGFMDVGTSLALDPSGNIVVLGTQFMHIFIWKFDKDGRQQWITFFGGDSKGVLDDTGEDLAIDIEGNIHVVGRYEGNGDFGSFSLPDSNNAYIVKLNREGKITWAKSYRGLALAIEVDHANDIIFSGSIWEEYQFDDIEVNGPAGLIAKVDPSGNFSWVKTIPHTVVGNLAISFNSNIIAVGRHLQQASFDGISLYGTTSGTGNQFVASLHSSGYTNWAMKIGDDVQYRYSFPVATGKDNYIYVGNQFNEEGFFGCQQVTPEFQKNFFLTKINEVSPQINGLTSSCIDADPFFSIENSVSLAAYSWEGFGVLSTNNITVLSDSSVKVQFEQAGVALLKAQTTFDNGCFSIPINISKSIEAISPITTLGSIQGPSVVCPNQQNIEFTSSIVPFASNYQWILPEGLTFIKETDTLILVNIQEGFIDGEINLKVSNDCGEASFSPYLVNTIPPVTAGKKISGPDILCPGEQNVTFVTEEIENSLGYRWNLPSGIVPINGSPITTSNSIKVNIESSVELNPITVRGYNSCTDGPESPPFIFTLKTSPDNAGEISGSSIVCVGETAKYSVNPIPEADSYQWSFSKGMVASPVLTHSTQENFIEVNLLKSGTVSVKAVNTCGPGIKSAPYHTTVTSLEEYVVPEIVKSCNSLYKKESNESFEWYLDGVLLSQASEIEIDNPGLYELVNQTLCGPLKDEILIMDKDLETFIPNVFTPNNDGKNDYFELSKNLTGSKLAIFNRWGKMVYTSNNYNNDWDGINLPPGVYYYLIDPVCSNTLIKGYINIIKEYSK